MPDIADPAPVTTRRAQHAETAYDASVEACCAAVAARKLAYVAHFTYGIFDFAADADLSQDTGRGASATRDRAGRQFNLTVTQLDAACQPLDSGPVIRAVIQGEAGAMFHYMEFAGQNFFGLALGGDPSAVTRADQQMTELAEDAVERLGAESLNWGGFKARESTGELRRVYQPGSSNDTAVPPHVAASSQLEPDSVAEACIAALSRSGLHYIAISRLGHTGWSADILDDPVLAPFFQRVTPQLRRSGYAEVIRQVQLQSRRFGQLLEAIGSERLIRLVIDVARGAIYILPLSEDDYLIGVTLIQAQVDKADQQIRALFEQIAPLASAASARHASE